MIERANVTVECKHSVVSQREFGSFMDSIYSIIALKKAFHVSFNSFGWRARGRK